MISANPIKCCTNGNMLENRVEEEQQQTSIEWISDWTKIGALHQKWVRTIIRIMMIIVRDNHPLKNVYIYCFFHRKRPSAHGCNYSEKIVVHSLRNIGCCCVVLFVRVKKYVGLVLMSSVWMYRYIAKSMMLLYHLSSGRLAEDNFFF